MHNNTIDMLNRSIYSNLIFDHFEYDQILDDETQMLFSNLESNFSSKSCIENQKYNDNEKIFL